MGVACASARCATESYRVIDKTEYKRLLDQVKIERV